MSQWDFGYGREPTEHHEPRYPQQPPYSYPEEQEAEYPYAQGPQDPEFSYPQEPQYQYPEASQGPQYPQTAPEPPYEYPQAAPEPPYEYPQAPQYQYPEPAAGPQYEYPQPAAGPQYEYPQPAPRPQYEYPQAAPGPQYPPAQLPQDLRAQLPQDLHAQQPPFPYPYPPPGESVAAASVPDDAGWSDNGGWPGADGYPAGGEAYDPPAAYPITYERDGFEGRASLPAASPPVAPEPRVGPPSSPWPDAPHPADGFGIEPSANRWRPPPPPVGEPGTADRTRAWYPGRPPHYPDGPAYLGPDRSGGPRTQPGAGWRRGGGPWPEGDEPWPQGDEGWDDDRPDRGRWLIPAAVAVAGAAVGAGIVMFALGHARAAARTTSPTTGASSSTGAAGAASATAGAGPTPLTLAAARGVLSAYTTANNSANARRSAATLATVETGGSYAIDAGLYTVQAAAGVAPYAPFTPVAATYYIPRAEAADGTRWFVVQVANAFSADPKKVTSTEYLLFTQAASGGWQNAVEPYLLAGAAAPQISVGGDGLATAVSGTSASLAVAPGQLAERTAASIDGTGSGVTVADPGALADRSDQTFWRGKLPTATVTDAHAAATGDAGQTFALRTANGGALVFYTDAANLAITPPAGSVIHLTVPGLYSPAQALSRAGLSYLDQFAADDPPAGAGTPRIVAEYSGITGKN
jgi:hypothetical protein